jgi:hypothetical protein
MKYLRPDSRWSVLRDAPHWTKVQYLFDFHSCKLPIQVRSQREALLVSLFRRKSLDRLGTPSLSNGPESKEIDWNLPYQEWGGLCQAWKDVPYAVICSRVVHSIYAAILSGDGEVACLENRLRFMW